jgi:AcrR family transcriptional regulator
LQDAAFELFLENGFAGTTVEQITNRAGVSRNTFFNYFGAKGDVFWVELDQSLKCLSASLRDSSAETSPMQGVLDAMLEFGREFGPGRVPFALTQYELIGSVHELQASALTRFTAQAAIIREFLVSRGMDPLGAGAAAYATIGAAVAAGQAWAAAGTARGEVGPFLQAALAPVVDGFARMGS